MFKNTFSLKNTEDKEKFARQIFGKRLAEIRKSLNLKQLELADLLSVSEKAISRYENGRTFPNNSFLIEIATRLGISIDYILGVSESKYLKKSRIFYNNNGYLPYHFEIKKNQKEPIHIKGKLEYTFGLILSPCDESPEGMQPWLCLNFKKENQDFYNAIFGDSILDYVNLINLLQPLNLYFPTYSDENLSPALKTTLVIHNENGLFNPDKDPLEKQLKYLPEQRTYYSTLNTYNFQVLNNNFGLNRNTHGFSSLINYWQQLDEKTRQKLMLNYWINHYSKAL